MKLLLGAFSEFRFYTIIKNLNSCLIVLMFAAVLVRLMQPLASGCWC